jgi:hypothetical protein
MLEKSINKKACENYLLMIPIRKVALWNKNVKTTFQEVLFYLPKYFRKGKGERKDITKEVAEKVIYPAGPIFLWMTPSPFTKPFFK